ncbi:phosphatase PAP2 family protein [Haloarcula halophila]|uniref:phosphatase PAP2 family protein n=1 Tax=Haloarcula TaxID=2237 RepID=UPI0023E41BF5|nr:phosphatase PAP2 family protein [Halomicroarcula sp. DFY41]
MTRGVGVADLLSSLPGVAVVLFALLTQLGDFWFTFSLSALLYWLGAQTPRVGHRLTRERAAMVVALLAAAVAVAVSLKGVFGLPRPVGAGVPAHADLVPAAFSGAYSSMATGDGYGFPSGHATTAVLVWGGLAWAVRIGTRRQRAAVAGGVALLIGLSRLVLGVHFLVDILAGFAIAGATLWLSVTRLGTPDRVFGLAAVVAAAGIVASGLTQDVAAGLGIGVGGAVAWQLVGQRVPEPTRRGATATAALGVGVVLTAAGVTLAVRPGPLTTGLAAAVGTALLLVMPLAGERLAGR